AQDLDNAEKRAAYLELLELYQGQLHPNCSANWVKAHRTEVSSLYHEAVEWLWKDSAANGDRKGVHDVLQHALTREPGSVRVMQALARFHDDEGRGEQVLEMVRAVVRHFREANVPPGEKTVAFVREMREKYGNSSSERGIFHMNTYTACIVD